MFRKYYGTSTIFTVIATALAGVYGYSAGGTTGAIAGAASAVFITLLLSVLEVSLSFDNAVINAKVLAGMSEVWRKRFITWGIPIAVFGMRFLFPLVIVDIVTPLNLIEVARLAFTKPHEYSEYLHGAHYMISAFGFGFLIMVALSWFIDPDKESHWFDPIENIAAKLHVLPAASVLIAFALLGAMELFVPFAHQLEVAIAGTVGIFMQVIIHWLAEKFGGQGIETGVARAGFASFMYLEILDASFSLDGVIGAFAITQSVPIIMAGLASGAFFVRSITLHLVDQGTLKQYEYLEHGAYYGITSLALIMLLSLSPEVHIPEVVTGLIGVGFIGAAIWNSIAKQKRDAVLAAG